MWPLGVVWVLGCGGPAPTHETSGDAATVDTVSSDTSDTSDTPDTPNTTDSARTSADTAPGDCASVDADQDGANACDDCDDTDPQRFPGAIERCDGLDDDCDGALVEGEVDADGDNQMDCAVCDQAGFWLPTRGLTGADLIAALEVLIDPLVCLDYSAATTFMFTELDKDPASSEVECVYTGRRIVVGNDKPDATDMNTEHTWPQSLGAEQIPAKCDLNHLFPTDSDANSKRGNSPFGVVTGAVTWQEGGSKLGSGAAGLVFEPRDVHKGNVARAMLYFAHQYGYALTAEEIALFKSWHAVDPVDDHEAARTLWIGAEQGSANPFVACPEMVDAL